MSLKFFRRNPFGRSSEFWVQIENLANMINIEDRINAFVKLGNLLKSLDSTVDSGDYLLKTLNKQIEESHLYNPWFTIENVKYAISSLANSLDESKIRKWLGAYDISQITESKRVGVVMAGNIPLVGFFDFLCVLISGNRFYGKLSSDDPKLLPAIAEVLISIEPEFKEQIEFTEGKLKGFDAIIATGSNNTARYFEYYFGKYPHIIRKNRNGVAVFTGNESDAELLEFGKDLFMYFGMGCRSVSKVFVPVGYKFDGLFEAIEGYSAAMDQFKYKNNYEYYKSIYLINKVPHLDNGFLLVKQDIVYPSPPSVLYYEEYEDISILRNRLKLDQEQIQCVVCNSSQIPNVVPLGQAQNPELWDYADGVDTIKFLVKL